MCVCVCVCWVDDNVLRVCVCLGMCWVGLIVNVLHVCLSMCGLGWLTFYVCVFECVGLGWLTFYVCVALAGGELFMQLEREGIFMEDTAWWVCVCLQPSAGLSLHSHLTISHMAFQTCIWVKAEGFLLAAFIWQKSPWLWATCIRRGLSTEIWSLRTSCSTTKVMLTLMLANEQAYQGRTSKC